MNEIDYDERETKRGIEHVIISSCRGRKVAMLTYNSCLKSVKNNKLTTKINKKKIRFFLTSGF